MKNLLLISSLTLLAFGSLAQNSSGLQQWQQEHPNKILMHSEVYQALDSIQQAQIQNQVVLIEDIDGSDGSFDLENVSNDVADQFASENFVKIWLAQNNTVKIVKRSEYEAADDDLKAKYDESHVLVLQGETVTRRDIENY
ncbi:MAG: hypothetical protein Crog4KO_18090 [Crocinitomicaceae bacterium]